LGPDFFILVISPYRQDEKRYSTKRLLIIIIQCKHRRVFHPINGSNVETCHNSASIDRQLQAMRSEIDTLQVAVASNDILSNKHQQSYADPISYFNSNTNSSTIYPIRHTIIVPTRPDPTTVQQKFQLQLSN